MRGLYLCAPHGSLIHEGKKTAIAIAAPLPLEGKRVICSKEEGVGLAFGVAMIGEPAILDVPSFERREDEHCVPPSGRLKWWPDAEVLYHYPILQYSPFEVPVEIDILPGTTMDMGEVPLGESFDESKAGSGSVSAPRQGFGVSAQPNARDKARDSDQSLMSSSSDPGMNQPVSYPEYPEYPEHPELPLVIPPLSGIMSSKEKSEMPWTARDATRHTEKADTPHKQKRWAEVANDALSRCLDEGRSQEECEGSAVRQANSVIAGMKELENEIEQEVTDRILSTIELTLKGTAADNDLPDSAFLYVEPGDKDDEGKTVPRSKRHLPYRTASGSLDLPRLRNALSRLGQPKTGKGWLTTSLRKQLITKAQRLLRNAKKEILGSDVEPATALKSLTELEFLDEIALDALSSLQKAGDLGEGQQGKVCTCPNCGFETEGEMGVPCRSQECPKCKAKLQGGDADEPMGEQGMSTGDERADNPDSEPSASPQEEPSQTITQYVVDKLRAVYIALAELFKRDTYTDKEPRVQALYKNSSTNSKRGFKTLGTDPHGCTWFQLWPTNAYRDREDEFFATKALHDYVARHADKPVKGEVWYQHTPGSKFGTIREQAVVADHFICQLGTYDDTLTGNAFKAFFEKYPDSHPTLAPHGWGASHQYDYIWEDRKDGVYEFFDIHESTVLPLHRAANVYNPTPILGGFKMNDEQKAAFDQIGKEVGVEDLADLIIAEGQAAKESLDARRVERKEVEDPSSQEEKEGPSVNPGQGVSNVVATLANLAKSIAEGEQDLGEASAEAQVPLSDLPAVPASDIALEVAEALQLGELSKMLEGLTADFKVLKEENATLRSTLASLQQADEVKQAQVAQALPRLSWMRASQAAETVIGDKTAASIKQEAQPVKSVPNAVKALASHMGGAA